MCLCICSCVVLFHVSWNSFLESSVATDVGAYAAMIDIGTVCVCYSNVHYSLVDWLNVLKNVDPVVVCYYSFSCKVVFFCVTS